MRTCRMITIFLTHEFSASARYQSYGISDASIEELLPMQAGTTTTTTKGNPHLQQSEGFRARLRVHGFGGLGFRLL